MKWEIITKLCAMAGDAMAAAYNENNSTYAEFAQRAMCCATLVAGELSEDEPTLEATSAAWNAALECVVWHELAIDASEILNRIRKVELRLS